MTKIKPVQAKSLETTTWCAPEVQPSGTISGRTIERLYATLPARADHSDTKIGKEIKNTNVAPKGYLFVSFDFAGQELTVASAFADSYLGNYSGQSKLAQAVLEGDKADETDMHSLTAKEARVPRSIAKNIIYALCYLCGVKTAGNTAKQGLPESQKHLGMEFGKKVVEGFKGKKNKLTQQYEGGLASDYFNYIYSKIGTDRPLLDYYNQLFPKSLSKQYTGQTGSPAQGNYTIQAACSTNGMLTGVLLFIRKEIKKAGLQEHCRFCVTIHDELMYLCKEEYTEDLAKCFVRAHAACWARLHFKLGIKDLPLSRLFFDIVVDVSKVMRKEANEKISTPTFEYTEMGYQYYVDRETGKLTKRNF